MLHSIFSNDVAISFKVLTRFVKVDLVLQKLNHCACTIRIRFCKFVLQELKY